MQPKAEHFGGSLTLKGSISLTINLTDSGQLEVCSERIVAFTYLLDITKDANNANLICIRI